MNPTRRNWFVRVSIVLACLGLAFLVGAAEYAVWTAATITPAGAVALTGTILLALALVVVLGAL